jgi:hypothetical protein
MPCANLRQDRDPHIAIEDIPIQFPSDLDPATQLSGCTPNLSVMEMDLREVQCHDALNRICTLHRAKVHCVKFCNANIRGQWWNTRAAVYFKGLLPRSVSPLQNTAE